MTIRVAPVSTRSARYAVMTWHYSRVMPKPPLSSVGVWEHERYIGAVIVGRGASPHLGERYGVGPYECAELVRVALDEHDAPVSQIVSAALRMITDASPRLRVLFSFADPAHGHHGGIYQAMNWTYLGESAPSRGWRHRATGKVLHQRVVTTSGVVRQFGRTIRAATPDECDRIEMPGKHRYALGLDRRMRRQLAALAQPYPPRGRSLNGETPGDQPGGAGSIPADRSALAR